MPPEAPKPSPFKLPLEFLSKAKFGGTVGKMTIISVVAMIILGVAVGAVWGNERAIYVIIGAVLLIVFGTFRNIHKTVSEFPILSMLDGSDLVAYRKVDVATKEKGVLPETLPVLSSGRLSGAVVWRR